MKTTLDELQTFVSIADSGSITSAAELLLQTPSGVSRTLSRLEKKLGCTLLRRTTRKIDLTQEGETFLSHAREILNSFEVAEESVKQKNIAPSGVLKVDSATPFILHAIVPYVKEFNGLYPGIQVELHSSDRIIDLLEKKIDVAIRIGKLDDSTLHAVSLGASRRRLMASPAYLKEHGTPKTVEDLDKHHLLGFTAPVRLNHWPLKTENGNSYPSKPRTMASSGETLIQLARQGVGIACLSDFMTKKDLAEGTLVQVLKSQTVDHREEIHAVYYKNTQVSQRVTLFIQFLKKKLKDQY
ncbi:LysR substrate-binding domain-containing protein [Bdellovibrio sp. HCB2-146]|uniref:LysR substrate-binding domain-containing protein n=1 Tax=Bdellovibrio sp. HCB2-146 TaxID=3394362 RepID=UPI0039BC925C